MPLPFSELGALLSRLEDIELRDRIYLHAGTKDAQLRAVVESWFKSHRAALNALRGNDAVALLSTLLPERRTDRVYGIQAASLCRILSRSLGLSAARAKDLQLYKQKERGDLGVCVERVVGVGGPPALPAVNHLEIDSLLQYLAGRSAFSAPHITRVPPSSEERDRRVGDIFKRLQPGEAKWLVRLILKDFSPVQLDDRLILWSFHILLPDILQFQNDFIAAIRLLHTTFVDYPSSCDPRSERLHRRSAREKLIPVVGIKVGTPNWTKARSMKHCMNMVAGQRWVLERKYDGEYCEIHIDLRKSSQPLKCITIFSKSKKDSTVDRSGLHRTIVDCLRLGEADSKITQQAILLGEMVVYSNAERRIMPFEKIRTHVKRSGRSIGTDYDSPPKPGEHLAIVFFDLLLLDNELVLSKPIDERRMYLREIYTKIPGRAMSAKWKTVDFSEDREAASERLLEQFAASNAERCEGLILKPCDTPYFALESDANGRLQTFIKLKKDYIAGLGDEADFAVIGASYNAQQALKSGIPNTHWTDFHLGCLTNKEDVRRFDARPMFRLVGTIQQDHCIPKLILHTANEIGRFCAKPLAAAGAFDVDQTGMSTNMDVIFDCPFVFEVLGSGFGKPSNSDIFMLRHPRVKKIHQDRSWKDCISFQELQRQAEESRKAPVDPVEENRECLKKLAAKERKLDKKFERERASKTPSTTRTGRTSTVETRRSELDGTTLVPTLMSTRKRAAEDTPCPGSKKLFAAKTCTVSPPTTKNTMTSTLADITNKVNNSPPSSSSPKPLFKSVPAPAPSRAELKRRLISLFGPPHLRASGRLGNTRSTVLQTGPSDSQLAEHTKAEAGSALPWRQPPAVISETQDAYRGRSS